MRDREGVEGMPVSELEAKKDRLGRANTAVRLDPDIYTKLVAASDAFGLSMNYLINYAIRDFLGRMIEPSELRLTREAEQ